MEQSVHVCELTYYPYIENNNEGGEGTEFHVGDIKKRRQFIYPRFCFWYWDCIILPDELLQKGKHLHKYHIQYKFQDR